MAGIKVQETRITDFYTHEGIKFDGGDLIVVRVDDRDVIGYFKGMDSGYFVIQTLDKSRTCKFRMATITAAKVVADIKFKEKQEGDE